MQNIDGKPDLSDALGTGKIDDPLEFPKKFLEQLKRDPISDSKVVLDLFYKFKSDVSKLHLDSQRIAYVLMKDLILNGQPFKNI